MFVGRNIAVVGQVLERLVGDRGGSLSRTAAQQLAGQFGVRSRILGQLPSLGSERGPLRQLRLISASRRGQGLDRV